MSASAPWLIRVASDPRHGAGHVKRGAALAVALAAEAPVVMVFDGDPGRWSEALRIDGVELVAAGREGDGPWRGAVLDGYDLPASGVADLARRARPLAVFDDLLAAPPEADLVVNAAIGLEGDQYDGVAACLGPDYACLDASFQAPTRRPITTVERVAITLGMTDPEDATGLVLDAFALLRADGVTPHLTVVMGSAAPRLDTVHTRVAALAGQAELRIDVTDMADLLAGTDLVVGAGGVSLFERLALGVPSVTLLIAENQRRFVDGAVARGVTVSGGDARRVDAKSLSGTILGIIKDRRWRQRLRDAGRALVDGRGAWRVAQTLQDISTNETDVGHLPHPLG